MIDLGFCGNPYTWSNHRQGSSLIKERLGRGTANCNWINFFHSYSVVHLPAHTSDHSPLLLNSNLLVQSLPRPFRFEAFWTRDPTCGIVIDEAWSALIAGSPSFCLTHKLKRLSNTGINIILVILKVNWIALSPYLTRFNKLRLRIPIWLWSSIFRNY